MNRLGAKRLLDPRKEFTVGVVSVALVLALVLVGLPNALDHALYDRSLGWIAPPVSEQVVIAAIDARSLQHIGRWPWSRSVLADFIERMREAGASSVTLDIAITEPNLSDPGGDQRLADAILRNGRVVLPVFPESSLRRGEVTEALPMTTLRDITRLGHSDLELESKGVSRGIYLKGGKGKPTYSTLALAALEVGEGTDPTRYVGTRHESSPSSGALWVRDHHVMIPFAGAPGSFRHISMVDILNQEAASADLTSKHVLAGVTADGLRSTFVTPMTGESTAMSGIEYHANVLNAALQRRLIQPLDYRPALALALLVAFLPAYVYSRVTMGKSVWIFTGISTALIALWLTSLRLGYWFALSPAIMVLAVGISHASWRHIHETARYLRREQERARVTLAAVGDGVLTLDADLKVRYMNPACQRLIGVRPHEVYGKPVTQVLSFREPRDGRRLQDVLDRCALTQDIVRPTEPFVLGTSSVRPLALRVTASAVTAEAAPIERYVVVLGDVTDALAMAQQMTHQATHDALTGLPNRLLLTDRIRQAIHAAKRSSESVAVMFMDLDGFKRINDTLGHTPGDQLLREVARRLDTGCRLSDTVARWGGDEFVVLMRGFSSKDAILGPAQELLDKLRETYHIEGTELHLSASIGIAVYPQDGESVEILLKHADAAMYQAKRDGRNHLVFFKEDDARWTHHHLEVETQLHRALRNDEFVVHYQPQYSIISSEVVGLEALIRWKHPDKGLLLPAQFLAIAEQSNLIEAIGERVMQIAFAQARRWQREGVPFGSISVNFSPRQFLRDDLLTRLDAIISETDVDPTRVKVEVTETLIVSESERVDNRLRAIKERGIRLALDDFGVGYSSLNHLKRLPLDELKIDKTFTRDIANRSRDAAITEAFITLAHNINLSVVAEGIESVAQMDVLRGQGCDQVQGYFVCPSLEATAVPSACKQIAEKMFAGLTARGALPVG